MVIRQKTLFRNLGLKMCFALEKTIEPLVDPPCSLTIRQFRSHRYHALPAEACALALLCVRPETARVTPCRHPRVRQETYHPYLCKRADWRLVELSICILLLGLARFIAAQDAPSADAAGRAHSPPRLRGREGARWARNSTG